MDRDMQKRLHAVAHAEGVEIVDIDTSRRHPHLIFRCGGKLYRHNVPGTPGEWRSVMNTVCYFRRRVRKLQQELSAVR